jgi:alpha-tubulin suppressor-like RCC1 family protein
MAYFDGKILRDIKLDREFGAAVLENGDVVQWGIAFSAENPLPLSTLEGKNITKIAISRDRVIALAKNGTVYSLPASRQDQLSGPKPMEDTWVPFMSMASPISYLKLTIPNLHWGERVTDISSGREHSLLLTNTGRLFSAASASEDYPTRGQLGIPDLTSATRPPGPFYQPQEIRALQNLRITKIATGDFHSLAFDEPNNRVFAFGDNTAGQLGWEPSVEASAVDSPTPIPINKLYNGTKLIPTITDIAAGGNNTFFTIDATRVAGFGEDPTGTSVGPITADTWACGTGIHGGLGNGRWTHVQGTPVKIKALSGLFEYDERTNQTVPIRLMRLSVGTTHVAAEMNNVTQLDSEERKDPNETNYGADVLVWGSNEFYQLGTGKRNNLSTPTYIAPLDPSMDKEIGRREEKRFQITPRKEIKFKGRKVEVEQRLECGRGVTAVYSAT